ncbi:MAG TPA: inositol monophosphatase family protein [Virgibacillus sp.]|nr:inositol monophosphatase family protein [Virgibacillus sp.]
MDLNTRESVFKQAKAWVLEAGQQIRESMFKPMDIDTKSNPNDLVTTIDKETEIYFVNKLKASYPTHLLFGEEGYGDDITSLDGTVWIIDPIDGTMNFVHQKRNFAISVGIYQDGVGEIGIIYDVMADVLYYAKKGMGAYKNDVQLQPLSPSVKLEESIIGLNHYWLCENGLVDEKVMANFVKTVRGTRNMGSAALEQAYVAEGVLDSYMAMNLAPWDIAAGKIIVQEVGGLVSDRDGLELDMLQKSSLVTGNQSIHQIIIQDFLKKGKK